MSNPTIYILYSGQSCDGTGPGEYAGYTTDKNEAIKCFKDSRKPYSTGYVEIMTQESKRRVIIEDELTGATWSTDDE